MVDRKALVLYNPHVRDWNMATTSASGSNESVATSSIVACSAVDVSREHRELFGMRRLGEDRKEFFDHFKFNNLIKGVSSRGVFGGVMKMMA